MAEAAQAAVSTTTASAPPSTDFARLLQKSFTPMDLLDDSNFDKIWRMADALANSHLSVPKELKGNIGDCLAIVTQALIWGLNPFAVAQKAHVINGKLGYEAQLVNAVVMQSGAIKGHFHYEYRGAGNTLECRVGAVLAGETQITWNEFYCVGDVKVKNSPLWATNPKQQLGYLQVKNWARAFTPGAVLGVYTADELRDIEPTAPPFDTTPAPAAAEAALPPYQQADFVKNMPAWTQLVASGKKTPSALLATLSTKATFNEVQKAQILALKRDASAPPPKDEPAAAPAPADPPYDDGHDDFRKEMDEAGQ
jgi:hypothetical protein